MRRKKDSFHWLLRRVMKVLINNLGGGGAERQVYYLQEQGITDFILMLMDKNAYDIPKDKTESLFKFSDGSLLKNILMLCLGPFKLNKRINSDEKVLSFLELSNFINILCSLFFSGHFTIISVRISPSFYNGKTLGFIYKALMKWLYPKARLISTNSEQGRLMLIDFLKVAPERVIVIKNALDLNKLKTRIDGEPPSLNQFKNNIVGIGRLSYQKNFSFLIKCFVLAREKVPGAKLIILGDGELKSELINLGHSLGLKVSLSEEDLEADIFLLGFQKNPHRFLGDHSIFVMPSRFEGLPNALIEAMGCGVPVISSDCETGPREILSPNSSFNTKLTVPEKAEFGILLPMHQEEENQNDYQAIWGEEIAKLLNSSEERKKYSEKSIERSLHYGLEAVALDWKNLLKGLK